MSIYRQFWLAIVTSMLLAFGGSLVASLLSARAYLEAELSIKNADNATALALAISLGKPDAAMVELSAAALFDSGRYELIRVVDAEGATLVEKAALPDDPDAPEWFVRLLPIEAIPGTAQISSGWDQVGTLTVISNRRFAYTVLWQGVWRVVVALALASLVAGGLGWLIVGRLKAPLQAVIEQATAITERRFVTIDEPRVPELKRLAMAMNATVRRLATIFADEAARLDRLHQEANLDPLTGLANRGHFMTQLQQWLDAEHFGEGSLLLIRLAHLADRNRHLGRTTTDELLRCLAATIREHAARDEQSLAGRLNGADFAMMLSSGCDPQVASAELLAALCEAGRPYSDEEAFAWIGYGHARHGTSLADLLARVDHALAAAEATGNSCTRGATAGEAQALPPTADQWSQAITRAVDRKWLRLASFPVIDTAGRLSHRECPLRLRFEEEGEWLPAGVFLPVAERLRLTPALDLVAVSLAIGQLRAYPAAHGLAINLAASSLANTRFRHTLLSMLNDAASDARRLWLEVGESGALRHLAAFREFCRDARAAGCRVGLEHFGNRVSQVGSLHDLALDYIKVDASFIGGIASNRGNQTFLKGLTTIAHALDWQVFAEGVATADELAAVADLGFDGATGPAVVEPAANPPRD